MIGIPVINVESTFAVDVDNHFAISADVNAGPAGRARFGNSHTPIGKGL